MTDPRVAKRIEHFLFPFAYFLLFVGLLIYVRHIVCLVKIPDRNGTGHPKFAN